MVLKEKVAIVTGAGQGIGKAIAELFAEEGAKVGVVDWNDETGQQTVQGIRQAGGDALFCPADVSKARDVENVVKQVREHYGKLNILVNNAAVSLMGQLVDTTEEVWDKVHSVNLKGVFLGCKFAIPAIIASGGGAVVNMASILGFVGDPDLAAYCAAKGGVIALTKVAALTYGPKGLRVNCICPGDVDTPMLQDCFNHSPDPEQARREISAKYTLRRIASPREIAKVALFLASDASSFITGAKLVADGALTIKCY